MKKHGNKGFSMVELIVVIAIMVVLLAVLAPSLLKYVENSRVQKDESAMDEVCNAAQLALADSNTFDEVFSYAIPNNYITYSDSSGEYGAKYTDEEFWAPDGSGSAVTITFNPDDNGTYYLADGIVNDMTFGNGSVASARVNDDVQQCYLEEMGKNSLLYNNLKKAVGETISEKSATYKNSSYTMFITYDLVNGVYRPDIYGSFNGTNLSEASPASLGSGTESYTPENEAVTTIPGGTTTPNYTSSDLSGGGTVGGGPTTWNNPYSPPGLTGGGTFNKATDTEPLVFTRTGTIKPIQEIKVNGNVIDATSYLLEDDNITLKLLVDYLKTLNVGDYTIEVTSEAGSASAQFEIKNMPSDTDTMIYDINNLDPNIKYTNLTITQENRALIGYNDDIQDLFIPVAIKNGNKWYKVTKISNVTYDTYGAFYKCTNLVNVFIPDTVIDMGSYAFSHCFNLESIQFSSNAPKIGSYYLAWCRKIQPLIIPEGVEELGTYVFCGSPATEIYLPSTLAKISDMPFYDCDYLSNFYYNGTIEQWKSISTIPSQNRWDYLDLPNVTFHCIDGCVNRAGEIVSCSQHS